MSRVLCWLDTFRLSFVSMLHGSYPIDGHLYYETYCNDDVQILKCMRCGKYSIGYFNGGEPQPQECSNE